MRWLAAVVFAATLLPNPARADAPAPTVTAKGWAVLDGKTGALLWGHNADEPLKAASTTKIMCARVVLQLAAKDPKVLDERVTFSKLADDTPGSTAAVKAGESLTVRDCLYGLLLPSGNDAGNAFAEHFSARLAAPAADLARAAGLDSERVASRANFLAEMNRAAKSLGLKSTVYRSPYGDGGDAKARTTTPRELGTLAWHAMKDDLFRQVVSTPKYECEVKTADGGTRKAAWKNTNRLLGKEGYDGVKTGTTTQAGSCLVSSGRRGKDRLIVVVLGSKSNDERYSDTEALFRWAWERRGAAK
jgi:serine-type D-Ala-D-Ala carboxypeptidase (penicillin-binding protein 5/6)